MFVYVLLLLISFQNSFSAQDMPCSGGEVTGRMINNTLGDDEQLKVIGGNSNDRIEDVMQTIADVNTYDDIQQAEFRHGLQTLHCDDYHIYCKELPVFHLREENQLMVLVNYLVFSSYLLRSTAFTFDESVSEVD